MARKDRDQDGHDDGNDQDATCTGGDKPTTTARTFGREPSFGPR